MDSSRKLRWGWLAFGAFLIAVFYALDQTHVGIEMRYASPWNNSTDSELYFTLGILALAFPGALFVAWGIAGPVYGGLQRIGQRINAMSPKETTVALVFLFGLGVIVEVVGNYNVLIGYPFTDDEYAARYGGQLLASGRAVEPAPEFLEALPTRFFFMKDGMITSFDYLGALLPWAFSSLTHSENLIFALFVGLGAVGIAGAVGTRLSPAWGAVAGALYLVSPMALSLSVTTHTHVVSRGFIAASLFTLALAQGRSSRLMWALTGLFAGGAFVTRPLHSATLLLPLFLVFLVDLRKADSKQKKAFGFFLVCLAVWGILMTLHSFAITDSIFPARFSSNEIPVPSAATEYFPRLAFLSDLDVFWKRFGGNLGYNFFMLCLWSLGPLTLPLAGIGVTVDRVTKALAAGIGLHFGLALLHDVSGIHMVGPIHYSETIIPTLILATYGLFRIKTWMESHSLNVAKVMATLLVGTVLACGIMAHGNLKGMHGQALAHAFIYGRLNDPQLANSVVLVPSYSSVWRAHPTFRRTGNYVFEWRKVAPDKADRVVILHNADRPTLDKIKAAYPERKIWQMLVDQRDEFLSFQLVP